MKLGRSNTRPGSGTVSERGPARMRHSNPRRAEKKKRDKYPVIVNYPALKGEACPLRMGDVRADYTT